MPIIQDSKSHREREELRRGDFLLNPADRNPLFLQIKQIFFKKIRGGYIKPGTRIPTNRQLADMLEVSFPTVRKAMAELEKEGWVTTRRGKGTFVCAPDELPRKVGQPTQTVAVVVTDSAHAEIARTLQGIENWFYEHGVFIKVCNSLLNFEREIAYLERILTSTAKGVIYYPNPKYYRNPECREKALAVIREIVDQKFPIVLLNQKIENLPLNLVATDDLEYSRLATQHLIDMGHRQLLYLGDLPDLKERSAGFVKTLQANEIDPDPRRIVALDDNKNDWMDALFRKIGRLMHTGIHFTGVVAASDDITRDVYWVMHRLGLQIPDDVSLVGQENQNFLKGLPQEITTVDLRADLIGREAAELLFRIQQNPESEPEHRYVKPHLIIRKSVLKL